MEGQPDHASRRPSLGPPRLHPGGAARARAARRPPAPDGPAAHRVPSRAGGGPLSGRPIDVLVVGGGPAGSTVARLLALRGWAVTLLDRARFPRAKPCGECLNPGAVEALSRLGLLHRVEALGPARLRGWRVESAGRVAVGSFPAWREGRSLARAGFDQAL